MDETESTPHLRAERVGARTYVGRNERGGAVTMGPLALTDAFTPGELLALAIAGCTGMSADSRIASQGEDVEISLDVTREKDEPENRYTSLAVNLTIRQSEGTRSREVDPARLARMLTSTEQAIEKLCTVSRTVSSGAHISVTLTLAED